MEWGAIVPDRACRWIMAAAPQPMQPPLACHRFLRAVPSLAPRHALTRVVWRAMLSHPREWMVTPGARYPPRPVLEQLRAPTPGLRHILHRASAPTEQLTDEVLDLALDPLRVLYPQANILPAGTSPIPPGTAAPCRGRTRGGLGETVAGTPQVVQRAGQLVPAPTPLPTSSRPGGPPAEPVPHAPGAPGRAGPPAAGSARPPTRAGTGGAAESFIVIFCCASPAACCWCRVPAACL